MYRKRSQNSDAIKATAKGRVSTQAMMEITALPERTLAFAHLSRALC
jgi:hypothetical protein